MSCRFVLAAIAAVGLCAAPAQAGPVAGAVAAVGGAFGAGGALAAGTLLGTAARFAITAGLSLLSQKLFAPSARSTLRVPFTGTGGTEAQETVWGRWVTGGHLVYRNTHGGNRRFLTDVIEVSDIPGVNLSRVIVDGEYAELGETAHPDYGFPILNDSKTNNQGAMGWVKFYDGTQTQADPMLVDKYSGDSERPWESTAVGTGIAYVIMTYRRGARLWPQVPQVFFEMEEPLAPDPRTGTPIRSRNNAVLIRRALLGYELPTGEVWGGAVPLQDVPDDNWFAAMDACDEIVGGRPRYQTGAAIRFDTRPIEVIQDFLDACSGQIAEIGGVWRIRIGEPATPVAHIDEGDVDIGQPFTYAPFRGTDETVTAIVPTYLEPEALWRPQALDAVVDTDLEETYGIQQTVDLPLNAVSSSEQAGQLSKEYLKDNERQRLHEFTLPPEFFFLRVLDTVTLTHSEYGYTSKLFEVVATTHDIRTMTVRVRVRERDPSDYAYDGNFDFPAPATPLEPVPAPALVLEGFDAEPYTPQADGSVDWRPGVRVKWTNGIDLDSEGVTEVAIQIKHATTQDILWAGFAEDVASGEAVAVGLPSGQQVEARARPVSAVFEGMWSDWVPVTTPQVDIKVTELEQATQDKIQTAFDRTNNAIALVDGSIGELRDQYAIPTAERVDLLETQVQDGTTGLLARVQTVETTKVDSAGAVAAVDAVVEAEYGDLAGMVTATSAAVATADAVVSKQFLGVVAGAAGASLELVAFDGDPGTGSSITLNADDVFAPGSIATSRLVVTEFGGNLIPNGSFISNDLRGWTDVTPGFAFTFGIVTVVGSPTPRVLGSMRLSVYPANLEITMARDIAVSEDDVFYMSYQYRGGPMGDGTIRMWIQWYDIDGQSLIPTAVSRSVNSNSWQKAEAFNVTPPSGAVRADVKFIRASGQGIVFSTEFRFLRSRPGATIITPQSISTPLLAAGAVTADKIEAGTITADRLILDGRTVAQGPGGALFVDEVDRSELTLVAASDLAADYTAGPINLQGQGEVVAAYVELGESSPDAVWLINFYMEVTNGFFQFQTRETEDGVVGPWQNRNNFTPTGAQFKKRSRARIEPGGMENVEFRILAQGSSGSSAIREAYITARALRR